MVGSSLPVGESGHVPVGQNQEVGTNSPDVASTVNVGTMSSGFAPEDKAEISQEAREMAQQAQERESARSSERHAKHEAEVKLMGEEGDDERSDKMGLNNEAPSRAEYNLSVDTKGTVVAEGISDEQ